jgi:CRP-like cAMP-binding protein
VAASSRRVVGLQPRTFGAGEMIFREGDAGRGEAYLVHEGKVEVRRRTPEGERVLRTLARGDLLGEVALFSNTPHSATAVALGPVTLLVVPAARLEQLVRAQPGLAIALIRQLARMATGQATGQDGAPAKPVSDRRRGPAVPRRPAGAR